MKRLAITTLASLLLAAPALAAARAEIHLTSHEARKASAANAEFTLGSLLYRSVGSAPVYVRGCRTHARRGICRVRVEGVQTCTYVSHVTEIRTSTYLVWGDSIRCA